MILWLLWHALYGIGGLGLVLAVISPPGTSRRRRRRW